MFTYLLIAIAITIVLNFPKGFKLWVHFFDKPTAILFVGITVLMVAGIFKLNIYLYQCGGMWTVVAWCWMLVYLTISIATIPKKWGI